MYIFGGATLRDFALAMILGELLGTYSSYAVATPLLAIWKTREPHWAKMEAKYGEAVQKTSVAPATDA
jgi:preprotein translocase subunit SecF